MSNLFEPRAQGDAWFRIGRLDVTSTMLVLFLAFAGLVVTLFAPAIGRALYFEPRLLLQAEVWRLFTWPLANFLSFWTLLTFLLLWYFGTLSQVSVVYGSLTLLCNLLADLLYAWLDPRVRHE